MAQTEEFMFQNVAYRLTVYRTGIFTKEKFMKSLYIYFWKTGLCINKIQFLSRFFSLASQAFHMKCKRFMLVQNTFDNLMDSSLGVRYGVADIQGRVANVVAVHDNLLTKWCV